MKKNAFIALAKDATIALATWGIFALLIGSLFEIDAAGAKMFAIYFAGLPFGWRIASNLITAVSLKGLGIKFLIATFIGCFAVVGILGWDLLRCIGPASRLCGKLIKGFFKGIAALVAAVVRMIRSRKAVPAC